jgi:hypothetical protein
MLKSLIMKELVEHIRAVHFTILLLALVLTAANHIQKKVALERAADDAEAIYEASLNWHEANAAMISQLNGEARLNPPHELEPHGSKGLLLPEGIYSASISLASGRTPTELFRIDSPWIYVDAEKSKEATPGELPRWTTLNEFITFWDGLNNGKRAFLPLILKPGQLPQSCQNLKEAKASDQAAYSTSVRLFYKAKQVGLRDWRLQPTLMSDQVLKTGCDFETAEVYPVDLNIEKALASVAAAATKWGSDPSSTEFKELISVSPHLGDSPLKDLVEAARDLENTDTERIEIFQSQWPVSDLPTYGTTILLLCQFYLLAHLLELRRLLKITTPLEWPTGYTGLYANVFVYGFTTLSLLVLPLIPLVHFVFYSAGTARYWRELAAIGSMALWLLCAWTLASIRKNRYIESPEPGSTNA